VQAGVADFTDGIQAVDIRTALRVDHDATAGVVRGRHHRDPVFGQIETKGQQFRL